MRKFFSLIWIFSAIAFVVVFFNSYIRLNREIKLFYDLKIMIALDRDVWFYSTLAVFILFGLLVRFLARTIAKIEFTFFPVPNLIFWKRNENIRAYADIFASGTWILGIYINLAIMLSVHYLVGLNHIDGVRFLPPYGYIIALGSMVAITPILLLSRFLIKKADLFNRN